MIAVERHDEVAKFLLERRLPGHRFVAPFAGFVVLRDGQPIGTYALNCFTGHDVELSVATYAPWPICAVREVARQCFVGLGVSRITAKTRTSNKAAIRALQACGFDCESVAKDHFGDEDAFVFALLRRNQKLVRI